MESPVTTSSLKAAVMDCSQASVLRIDESLSPASLDSVVITERDNSRSDKFATSSPINSVECLDADQVVVVPVFLQFDPTIAMLLPFNLRSDCLVGWCSFYKKFVLVSMRMISQALHISLFM